MFNSFARAFKEALHNLRSNFFQTLLSVLGIIIGVGALVAMLSLIDGLEAFARERISGKTDLEMVLVSSNTHRRVDGLRIRRDTTATIRATDVEALLTQMPQQVNAQRIATGSKISRHPVTAAPLGLTLLAVSLPIVDDSDLELLHGRTLAADDENEDVILVNPDLALRLLDSLETDTAAVLGRKLSIDDRSFRVVGVVSTEDGPPGSKLTAMLPIRRLPIQESGFEPRLVLSFANVDEVQAGKTFIEEWATTHYAGIEDPLQVVSQEFWLDEMQKGFLVFRLIMGLIVGIAVVVGGVGVMNVLLMSINERTTEIGIRKAVGANRGAIMRQFLAESIAISLIGSFFGVILGILLAMAAAPVTRLVITELDFRAVLTWRTVLTVAIIAVITGIVFGTYPARKAAALDPVVAIQRN